MIDKKWTPGEVDKAVKIIRNAESKKSNVVKILDKSVYWIVLLIVVLGNVAVSVMLIPVLLVLRSFMLYFVIAVLGVSFGLLFEILIRDIENLEKRHHFIISSVIPITALVSMGVITTITNKLEITLKLNNDQHSLLLVGGVYAIAFMLPYIYNLIKKQ